jgi:prepilin-type N-terminal cleavage/methylation domain
MHTNSITSPDLNFRGTLQLSHSIRNSRGFSLIELMVAMVLGLLVVAGLINLFVANRKAYQVQSGNNFLQENLRIASDRIGWSLRMADFWGGNKSVVVNSSASAAVTAKGSCTGTWATAVDPTATDGGAVHGYDGAASFPLDTMCIGGAANYVPGSDVLVVRYADPQMLSPGPAEAGFAPAESSTISGNPKQVFLLSTPGTSAQLFAGAPPSTTTIKTHRYAYPYQIDMYYLRPCSVIPSGGSKCTSSADGGLPLPTLMRMHLQNDGTFVSEPVVDGIEQIKYEYGVTAKMDDVVPVYQKASNVTQWANVVAVRVSVVAVNPARDTAIPHAKTYTLGTLNACSYIINNGSAATTTSCANFTPYGDNPWQFVRTDQQFVVQLRNRVRG